MSARKIMMSRIHKLLEENKVFFTEKYGEDLVRSLLSPQHLTDEQLKAWSVRLREEASIHRSPIDPERLADALQGVLPKQMAMCVMTPYVCDRCGSSHVSGSSFIPNMCRECAVEEANRILGSGLDLLKKE